MVTKLSLDNQVDRRIIWELTGNQYDPSDQFELDCYGKIMAVDKEEEEYDNFDDSKSDKDDEENS